MLRNNADSDVSLNAYQSQLGQSAVNKYGGATLRIALDDETIERIAKAVVRLLQGPPDPSMP